jgi:hypothetical protein
LAHRERTTGFVELGAGRPYTRAALADLGAAVAGRGPVTDWVRYRLLSAVLMAVVLVWCAVAAVTRVTAGDAGAPDGAVAAPETAVAAAAGEGGGARSAAARGGLRDDLFRAPQAKRKAEPTKPRTNPVELLELIELQGVLLRSNPRAMVTYKRTGESVTVSVGDDLGEFKVMEIRERSVVLKWRDELFELSL